MNTRRRLGAAAMLLGLLPLQPVVQPAMAMFARFTDAELLQGSDLIALGEWVGQASSSAGSGFDVGTLRITELLRGPAGLQQAQVLVRAPGGPRTGNEINFRPGDRGLWLLRLQPGSGGASSPPGSAPRYLADHPQRFERDTQRIEALRRLLALGTRGVSPTPPPASKP